MNHPDPIIETRNKYRQTLDTLKAARDTLYRAQDAVSRITESLARLEIERNEAEDSYTAALNARNPNRGDCDGTADWNELADREANR